MGKKFTVDYPESLPDVLQESAEQFEREARMAMAVKLFEMKRLSSGTAASIAGMDRVSFLLQLSKYGVSVIDMDEEELLSDVNHA